MLGMDLDYWFFSQADLERGLESPDTEFLLV
jgi:hypothetical protein